uniref:Uncharacterized protein n=1 Tax=viral metagenome TaxID=1070528 RepID=A0A6C0B7N1_9ZZZZ
MRVSLILLSAFQTNALSNRLVPRKLCRDCKHFIAHKEKCAIFGDTDFVNGSHDYNYAKSTRKNEDKCGEEAKYFEENTNKIVTVPYYFILNAAATYWPLTPLLVLLVIYASSLYKLTNPTN